MSRVLAVLLIVSLFAYFYVVYATVCPAPLSYEIVALDERFNLSDVEAATVVTEAQAAWQALAERDLFYPVAVGETPELRISFIFDDRQEKLLAEEALRETLDVKEYSTEEINQQYDSLVASYKEKQTDHAAAVVRYETELADYNATVARYNEEGGAPPSVYDELEASQRRLARLQAALNVTSDDLNREAQEINRLGEQGNRLIKQYNETVEAYNEDFGEPDEFTQGDYQGGDVHVYTFTDRAELVNVLAHEFGHALNIGHVEGSASIMYYLMEDQPALPALSTADQAAFTAACGEPDSFTTWARALFNRYF